MGGISLSQQPSSQVKTKINEQAFFVKEATIGEVFTRPNFATIQGCFYLAGYSWGSHLNNRPLKLAVC